MILNKFSKTLLVSVSSATLIASAGVPAVAVDGVTRVSGADRYATAAEIQAKLLPDAQVVFLATGRNFPDALSAGPAAAKTNGAILLADGDSLPSSTVAAIKRMKPKAIYVIGGASVVSEAAFKEAKALAPNAKAERIAGADRYDTSLAIAKKFFGASPAKRYVASGINFPDALAGGALAGKEKVPLILVPNNPAHVNVSFGKSGVTIVLGGRSVISDAVYRATGASKRYAGNSRYATAKAILDEGYSGATMVIYASGVNFPDALAAVPAAAVKGIPLFLSGQTFTPVTITLKGWVVGGPKAVADSAWANAVPPKPKPSGRLKPKPNQPRERDNDGTSLVQGRNADGLITLTCPGGGSGAEYIWEHVGYKIFSDIAVAPIEGKFGLDLERQHQATVTLEDPTWGTATIKPGELRCTVKQGGTVIGQSTNARVIQVAPIYPELGLKSTTEKLSTANGPIPAGTVVAVINDFDQVKRVINRAKGVDPDAELQEGDIIAYKGIPVGYFELHKALDFDVDLSNGQVRTKQQINKGDSGAMVARVEIRKITGVATGSVSNKFSPVILINKN